MKWKWNGNLWFVNVAMFSVVVGVLVCCARHQIVKKVKLLKREKKVGAICTEK